MEVSMADHTADELSNKIMASLSTVMLDIAKGPLAAMEKAKAGHGLDKATMASLSANMKKLANQASLAASMSALLAKFRK
jgi:hypothetical protein